MNTLHCFMEIGYPELLLTYLYRKNEWIPKNRITTEYEWKSYPWKFLSRTRVVP
jgi:hypothetical protein